MYTGQNGCGKTTIIESLKYALTGNLPPNSKLGQGFVNDPSMTDTTEVKASIRLKFKNKTGNDCVAVRSLTVTKKKSSLQFKALDSTLRTLAANGEKTSLSVKCSEMDAIVPPLLGVSPAVLDSVILCHQEESNWPVQEGTILKKKFDDIFESTRYTKALDVFSKAKKEHMSKAKDFKGEVMELAAHLSAARSLQGDLARYQDQLDNCRSELDQVLDSLQANTTKQAKLQVTLANKRQEVEELQRHKQRSNEATRKVEEKQKYVESLLDNETDAELNETLSNFQSQVTAKTRKLADKERESTQAQQAIEALRREADDLKERKGTLTALYEQALTKQQEQLANCRTCGLTYNIMFDAPAW